MHVTLPLLHLHSPLIVRKLCTLFWQQAQLHCRRLLCAHRALATMSGLFLNSRQDLAASSHVSHMDEPKDYVRMRPHLMYCSPA